MGRLVIQLPPPPLSLIFVLHVCAQTRTFMHTLFLRFTPSQDAYDPPPAPYSPCTEISRRGTEYLRDTETDSLQLYWPPRLLHLPLPYPGCRTASQAALPTLPACLPARCLDCQPVSSAALVIGFPRFSQLFLKSFATLSTLFSRLSSSLSLFGARVVLSTASSAFLRALHG